MNATEYLSQAFLLEQQVESKLCQLESLKAIATRITACYEKEPVSHTPNVTSMQDTIIRIVEAEEELNHQIDALVDTKREIAATISRVRNVMYRLILEKRHLCFQAWEDIAEDMGYTDRWLKVMHRQAVNVVQGLLDEEGRE